MNDFHQKYYNSTYISILSNISKIKFEQIQSGKKKKNGTREEFTLDIAEIPTYKSKKINNLCQSIKETLINIEKNWYFYLLLLSSTCPLPPSIVILSK